MGINSKLTSHAITQTTLVRPENSPFKPHLPFLPTHPIYSKPKAVPVFYS